MTVSELVAQLSKFDGNMQVLYSACVESGRGFASCMYAGDVNVTLQDNAQVLEMLEAAAEEYYRDDELIEQVSEHKKFVVIDVNGPENYYE